MDSLIIPFPSRHSSIDPRFKQSNDRERSTNDSHERGQVVIPMSRFSVVRDCDGRYVVDELRLCRKVLASKQTSLQPILEIKAFGLPGTISLR